VRYVGFGMAPIVDGAVAQDQEVRPTPFVDGLR
jgi:hypothetical protein